MNKEQLNKIIEDLFASISILDLKIDWCDVTGISLMDKTICLEEYLNKRKSVKGLVFLATAIAHEIGHYIDYLNSENKVNFLDKVHEHLIAFNSRGFCSQFIYDCEVVAWNIAESILNCEFGFDVGNKYYKALKKHCLSKYKSKLNKTKKRMMKALKRSKYGK